MTYTKEQMIAAFVAGTDWANQPVDWNAPHERSLGAGERYVTQLHNALRRPLEASRIHDHPSSVASYLPPIGTPEEVAAKVLTSLLCRTAMMFQGQPGALCLFSENWQEAQLEGLRSAYPALGAVEDVRVEERV